MMPTAVNFPRFNAIHPDVRSNESSLVTYNSHLKPVEKHDEPVSQSWGSDYIQRDSIRTQTDSLAYIEPDSARYTIQGAHVVESNRPVNPIMDVHVAKSILSQMSDQSASAQYHETGILFLDQSEALQSLSRNPTSDVNATHYGFLSPEVAAQKAGHMSGSDWGPKSPYTDKQKMQIATVEVEKEISTGLGYQRYMGIQASKGDPIAQKFVQEHTVRQWASTLSPPNQNALTAHLGATKAQRATEQQEAANGILNRFAQLISKDLKHNDTSDPGVWHDWNQPLASAMSHGGRINVIIPPTIKRADQHAVWDWLMGGTRNTRQAELQPRLAATHGIKFDKHLRPFEVKHNKLNAILDGGHYGMNLTIGGLGNKNVNGDIILANGSNGHLYINYTPPTPKRPGVIMVGVESSAPGKSNPYGKGHDTSGRAGEFSATGGLKRNKMGTEFGGRIADLTPHGDELIAYLDGLPKSNTALLIAPTL